jgi:hypothetical protein
VLRKLGGCAECTFRRSPCGRFRDRRTELNPRFAGDATGQNCDATSRNCDAPSRDRHSGSGYAPDDAWNYLAQRKSECDRARSELTG